MQERLTLRIKRGDEKERKRKKRQKERKERKKRHILTTLFLHARM